MKIALIDLSGLFWTLWFGYSARSETEELALSSTWDRCLGYIRFWAREHGHVGVAADSPPYDRALRHPDYKAGRQEKPAIAIDLLKRLRIQLLDEGIYLMAQPGLEADDMIASAVRALSHATDIDGEVAITIYSRDKDLHQLVRVGDPTVVCRPFKGSEVWDEGKVFAEMGVQPWQVHQYLALMGDSSDNIEGVKGVGPKAARSILKHSSVVNVIASIERGERLEAIPTGVWTKLKAAVASGELQKALSLIELVDTAEIALGELLRPYREPSSERADSVQSVSSAPIEHRPTEPPPPPTPRAAADEQVAIPEAEPTMPSQPEPTVVEPEPQAVFDAVPEPEPEPEPSSGVQTAALVPAGGEWNRALEPTEIEGAWKVARRLASSMLFGYEDPNDALAIILAGRELGLGAAASSRGFHIIHDKKRGTKKLGMNAQMMMALCRRHPNCEVFRVVAAECNRDQAIVEVKKRGEVLQRWSFTAEDAKDAGLLNRNIWQSYRKLMLINRAIAIAARFEFPELCHGMHDPEELSA